MKYANRFRVIVIGVLAAAFLGCTPAVPVGSIGSGGAVLGASTGTLDSLLVVPQRSLYNVNEVLFRHDFTAFAHSDGSLINIPSQNLDIAIVEDLGRPDDITPVPREDGYLFMSGGSKGVVVFHDNLSARYTVQVLDPLGLGGESGGSGGGGGPGINITW